MEQSLIENINDRRQCVAIFGTGSAGKTVFRLCKQLGIVVEIFLDNNSDKWSDELEGIPINSPTKFIESFGCEFPVIVASRHDVEITIQLKAMNMKNIISIRDLSNIEEKKCDQRLSVDEDLFKANEVFYGKHKGERCFILATGPSINNQDLRALRNEVCLAVGLFFLHDDISTIQPMYQLQPPNHPPFTFDNLEKYYQQASIRNMHAPHYFIGHREYEFATVRFLAENRHICPKNYSYINYHNAPYIDEHNLKDPTLWDMCGNPFAARTVVYMAIQMALYMGFSEIYLHGVDHDYLHDVNRVENHHFYPEEEGHSDVELLSQFTTERWFKEYYFRWRDYRLMQTYLKEQGVSIYNATRGGMLDVFPRVTLEHLL